MRKVHMCACLLSVLSIVEMKTLNEEAPVGTNVTVVCSDWNAWTDVKHNDKYLCESPCSGDKHIIIKAAFKETKYKNRIEITNSAEGLFVTFIHLTMSDSKTYYCGVDRVGPDSFIEVNLKVVDGPKTPAKTVTVGSPVLFAVTNSSTMSSSNSDFIMDLSNATVYTTPTASALQATRTVTYLTICFIIIITTLILLFKLMRNMKRQQKVVSAAGSPQEDVEYDEIGLEDQQTEGHPVAVSTVQFATANTDVDPDSLYENLDYLQGTKLAAQSEILVYSVTQLPKERRGHTGQSELAENDNLYSLAQLPQAT